MTYARWVKDLSRADFLKSAGLFVLPDRLCLVRMRKSLFPISVVSQELTEVAPGENPSQRRQALSEAIRTLLPHFDPVRDPFYICLSPHLVMSLELSFPQVAKENLTQAVEYELERQIPLRREDVYYDFLPGGQKGDKIPVFLFAVPKRILDEILDVLDAFGIRPKGVETTATAIANYLLFSTGDIKGPAVVLGEQKGAWDLIGLNVGANGWIEEPEILFNHWLPHAEWISGTGKEIFHRCMADSPRLFGWGGYVADFLLSGEKESLQVENLLTAGTARLGANNELGHPFFIPAVGAALRGLREATFSVNLLPGSEKREAGKALSRLNAAITALLILGLCAWGGSYPLKGEIRLRQLQKENEKIAPAVAALRREEEQLNRLRKERLSLSELSGSKGEILKILEELARIVPTTAYLSSLRYRTDSVELQGSAENASNLIPLLERSPLFENVKFTAPSNRGRDNRDTFSVRADIERPKTKTANP
ncbi:MAG: hypothetical protein A3I10_02400 [Deltaproteobacteria bacterium RIFCSPLOWO2_02_FULL_57_26]|nr:MAG: hypothetical protein A3I10_02400 [Deltaproteobacteria bacterium RIFCSPLOWO2_02_FULL_57_26]OGQ79537.1 MAG: hypothetical protein A3G40_13300 [Deltaproteobacteria bacterium RIFCSPLOWO2_12_FULL_57_22]